MILLEIPRRVTIALVEEWLGGKELARLDAALTAHDLRQTFWNILNQHPLRLHPQFLASLLCNDSVFLHFMMWTIYRGVRLHTIFVKLRPMQALARMPFFRFRNTYCLHLVQDGSAVRIESLETFISFFPDLEELDCSRWPSMSGEQLLTVMQNCFPLHALNLLGCSALLPDTICEALKMMGSYLRTLHVDVVSDDVLHSLSTYCQYLLQFIFCRDGCSPSALYASLERLHRLKGLSIRCTQQTIAESTPLDFHQLFSACPALETVDFSADASASPSILTDAFQLCPKIVSITLKEVHATCRSIHGHRVCDVRMLSPCSLAYLLELFEHCKLPIRSLHTHASLVELDGQILTALVDHHGLTLESLVCDLQPELRYSHTLVDCLLARCTRLRECNLGRCWMAKDKEVQQIASLCPALRRLHLSLYPVASTCK